MTLGAELAELSGLYRKAALQTSLIKLYSHINWSKIYTTDQEVLYFFDEETGSVRKQRVLWCFKADLHAYLDLELKGILVPFAKK